LRHDAHVRLTADQGIDPFANNGMVIHHQNPNRIRVLAHDFISWSFPENFSASR
jgi:hypothetical protein